MQVRFSHPKERQPEREHGLRVLYGPSRRLGFRWRWYLILALVSSPLLWLVGRLLLGAIWQEAPAQLTLASEEIRAVESGRVETLPVRSGARVQAGQVLVRLRNPEWELRLRQLETNAAAAPGRGTAAAGAPGLAAERALQQRAIALQGRTVQLYRSLERSGGFSRAELLQAETQLTNQRLAGHALERRLQQEQDQRQGTPLEGQRSEQERRWLSTRLSQLVQRASHGGRVAELLVTPGENVGPGTLLMRLERPEAPQLWIYLQPRSGLQAWPGRPLAVQLPDGSWRRARVSGTADLARRPPAGLSADSRDTALALRVPARFEAPLPPRWRIDQLPLKVRFQPFGP